MKLSDISTEDLLARYQEEFGHYISLTKKAEEIYREITKQRTTIEELIRELDVRHQEIEPTANNKDAEQA